MHLAKKNIRRFFNNFARGNGEKIFKKITTTKSICTTENQPKVLCKVSEF